MSDIVKTRATIWKTASEKPAFYMQATLKGLEILLGLLATAKEIRDVLKDLRDMQGKQRRLFTSDEAEKALGVSKNTLKAMRANGTLTEGIHFRLVNGTLRFAPNLGHLFIRHAPNNSTSDVSATSTENSYTDKQAAQQHTRNTFKRKE
jgi:hypothetical protein